MSRIDFAGILRAAMPRGVGVGARIAIVLGAAGYAVYQSIYNVEGGHRAIVFNRLTGIREVVYAEGTHFRMPWLEWPIIFDVRTKPHVIATHTGSRDLQMVDISIRLLSRPSVSKLPTIYRTLGTDYNERVLPSIANEILKSVVAQFTASQLLTQREQVSRLIRKRLIARARDFHIMLDDVSITHLKFGREFSAAIEAKQVAQQEAERAKFKVQKAEQERRSAVIMAEGEARSAELIGQAMRDNPAFVTLRRIDAAREIANTISRSQNRVYLSTDSLLLNLGSDAIASGVEGLVPSDVPPISLEEITDAAQSAASDALASSETIETPAVSSDSA